MRQWSKKVLANCTIWGCDRLWKLLGIDCNIYMYLLLIDKGYQTTNMWVDLHVGWFRGQWLIWVALQDMNMILGFKGCLCTSIMRVQVLE